MAFKAASFLICVIIALAAPAAGAIEYSLLGPPGGSFKSIEYCRDGILLAGGFNGRLYVSTHYGEFWKDITPASLTRGMTVEQITFHPTTDTVYFVFRDLRRGLLIRTSVDQLRSGVFTPDILMPELPIRSLALSEEDPPRIFVGTNERLHYSFNGGRSWKSAEMQLPNTEIESLAIDPNDPDLLYAGSWQRPFKTRDFGRTWIPVHSGMAPDSDVFTLFFDTGDRLWAGTCGHAYRRDSESVSWVKKRIGLKGKRIHCLAHAGRNSHGDVLAGTENGLHLFRDAADAWMQIIPEVVVHDITKDEHGLLYIATEGSGVMRYRFDPPETESMNSGLDASSPGAMTGSLESVLWTGLVYQHAHNGLWRYFNRSWSRVPLDCNGINIRSLISTDRYLFAATSNGVFRMALDPVYHLETDDRRWFLKGKTIKTMYLEHDGVTLLVGGFDGIYQVNTETGHEVLYYGTSEINVNCIWKCPVTGLLMAGAEGALFRLEPGQAKWERAALPAEVARISRITGTRDGAQIYLATSSGVMASYDNGCRFTQATGNLPDGSCLDICLRENTPFQNKSRAEDIGEPFADGSRSGGDGEKNGQKNGAGRIEGQVFVLLGDHSVYWRALSEFSWEILVTLPFDSWSIHAPPGATHVCVGTPANGIVALPFETHDASAPVDAIR
ncbi:hypothetical protein JXA80_00700 [bacterium]|nr:hypothetical protein [candidate division CSSED10-310 bacterium]